MKAAFFVRPDIFDLVYGEGARAQVQADAPITLDPPSDTEALFASWGSPRLDADLLRRLPDLKLVLYAAGTPALATDEFWETGIPLCTAKSANARPVAQFALGVILLSLKGFYRCTSLTRQGLWTKPADRPGLYGSTVGLIGMGEIGRLVRGHLAAFQVRALTYDPYLPEESNCASLEELFSASDVVSLHAPNVPANRGLVDRSLMTLLPKGATLVNTARGALIVESDLIEIARERSDLTFVLDVTDPEPPIPGSPLYSLANVTLTPHIAGSEGRECRLMGQLMVEEYIRFLMKEPLEYLYPAELRDRIA